MYNKTDKVFVVSHKTRGVMDCPSALRSYVPQNQAEPGTVVVVGVLYFGYFVFALAGIVLMATNVGEDWPVVFSSNVVFVSSALHFGFTAVGYVLYEGYEHAQVDPVWLFLFADYFQAGALGAALASRNMDASSRPTVYASASVVMVAQLACLYKTITLLCNPRAARSASASSRPSKLSPIFGLAVPTFTVSVP